MKTAYLLGDFEANDGNCLSSVDHIRGFNSPLLLACFTAPFAIVYRSNYSAPIVAFLLLAVGVGLWRWWGGHCLTIGPLEGAWRWVVAIRRADAHGAVIMRPSASARLYRKIEASQFASVGI